MGNLGDLKRSTDELGAVEKKCPKTLKHQKTPKLVDCKQRQTHVNVFGGPQVALGSVFGTSLNPYPPFGGPELEEMAYY